MVVIYSLAAPLSCLLLGVFGGNFYRSIRALIERNLVAKKSDVRADLESIWRRREMVITHLGYHNPFVIRLGGQAGSARRIYYIYTKCIKYNNGFSLIGRNRDRSGLLPMP